VIRSVYEDENEPKAGLLQPALHKAAGTENDGTFEILLNHGVDVHSADRLQQTALQEAFRQEHATTVKMLVDYGADPNARAVNPPSLYSGTALQQAAGADPNAQCGHYGGVSATMIEEEPVCKGSPGYGRCRK